MPQSFRIAVTRQLPGPAIAQLRTLGHQLDVWPEPHPPTPPQLLALLSEADAAITMLSDRIDAAVLDAAPRLKVIANYAVGYDNIDLEAVRKRNIAVGNTPDVLTDATADLAFALLLAAARQIVPAAEHARTGRWTSWEPAGFLGAQVYGRTLGIIGYGRIGRAVAQRARGFDMTVLHTRETPLSELFAQSDFVSLHTPLNQTSRHIIDADALAAMKPSAILINTSRGQVVDQAALITALNQGTIAGAALDVTDPEPPPQTDPIWKAPHLLIVPHIGSASDVTRGKMGEMAAANVLAALQDQPLPYPVFQPASGER
jgi:glyoxylate reductase